MIALAISLGFMGRRALLSMSNVASAKVSFLGLDVRMAESSYGGSETGTLT